MEQEHKLHLLLDYTLHVLLALAELVQLKYFQNWTHFYFFVENLKLQRTLQPETETRKKTLLTPCNLL